MVSCLLKLVIQLSLVVASYFIMAGFLLLEFLFANVWTFLVLVMVRMAVLIGFNTVLLVLPFASLVLLAGVKVGVRLIHLMIAFVFSCV